MKVLIIGSSERGTISSFFMKALRALGHEGRLVEADYLHHRASLVRRLGARSLGRPLTYWKTNRDVIQTGSEYRPDVVIVPKGAWISPGTLSRLKKETGAFLINFATDDPFNTAVSTRMLVEGIPFYDLYVSTKRNVMADIQNAGGKNVIFCPFGYDPDTHFPERPKGQEDAKRFSSDVVFIGAADPDRRPTMRYLASRLGPSRSLGLYGGFWNRDLSLRQYYRGFAIDREYRLALCGSRVALGLVRRANRDGHAMRSFEIPACRVFMLAERTEEHQEFFVEGKHVAYFSSDEELADKTLFYLSNTSEREKMASACYELVRRGNTYQDRLSQILQALPRHR